ncbi:MAG: flagellar motor switch protein FliN [Hyphomicrobiales bacterium]
MSDEPETPPMTESPAMDDGSGASLALNEHAQPSKETDDGIIEEKNPADLETVFDVPVKVSAVLGRSRMKVADLMKLDRGSILELDRKVGESIDVFVNNRLIARGEVVLVDNQLGVTMTEIIAQD